MRLRPAVLDLAGSPTPGRNIAQNGCLETATKLAGNQDGGSLMTRVLKLIVSIVLAASLSGCIFYERPHHHRPPAYGYPYRGY